MTKEKNEENIGEGNEEVGNKENFEWNKEHYNQGNACVNDDAIHGHGVKGRNSNIVGRCRSKWWRTKCDLVDNVGVFLAKGCAVAHDPQEAVFDD
jgi:hypothetical protein